MVTDSVSSPSLPFHSPNQNVQRTTLQTRSHHHNSHQILCVSMGNCSDHICVLQFCRNLRHLSVSFNANQQLILLGRLLFFFFSVLRQLPQKENTNKEDKRKEKIKQRELSKKNPQIYKNGFNRVSIH